jgi:hypothetical protein
LNLSLFEQPDGVERLPGNRVVYDLERNEAHFGDAAVGGPAIVWELAEYGAEGSTLSVDLELDPWMQWLMRCDRIDFPPGGVAYRHTHPGAGIRRLLFGSIRIEGPDGLVQEVEPGGAWYEGFDYPVLATASESEPSAFVRVLVLPREWEGKRTIKYVDPGDDEKPKLQKPTVFFDRPIEL